VGDLLRAAEEDADWKVRRDAMVELVDAHAEEAADPILALLIGRLEDPSKGVRQAAIRGLRRFGPAAEAAAPLLAPFLTQRARTRAGRGMHVEAGATLVELGDAGLRVLATALGEGDVDDREGVLESVFYAQAWRSASSACRILVEPLVAILGGSAGAQLSLPAKRILAQLIAAAEGEAWTALESQIPARVWKLEAREREADSDRPW
jgi:hypothetical protein